MAETDVQGVQLHKTKPVPCKDLVLIIQSVPPKWGQLQTKFSIFKTTYVKKKTCFEILVKKAFRWHLETWENQIGSIFKLNIKKKCQIPKKNWHQSTPSFSETFFLR